MSHNYSRNVVHLVFSTKGRAKRVSRDFQPELWAYIGGICKREGVFVRAIDEPIICIV